MKVVIRLSLTTNVTMAVDDDTLTIDVAADAAGKKNPLRINDDGNLTADEAWLERDRQRRENEDAAERNP